MSSSKHWRGRKILDLCASKEDINRQTAPESSQASFPKEWSVVENVEIEMIISKEISDDLSLSTHCDSFSPADLNNVLVGDISSILSPQNNDTKDDYVTLNQEVNNNSHIEPQNTEQEVQFEDIMISPLDESPLLELMTDDHNCSNSLVSENTIEQSTLQQIENSPRNSFTGTIDHSVTSRPSIQIDDLISDESRQEGLVPYKINSDSESDCENYPKKSNKRRKRIHSQKSNWYAESNRKLRESGKKYYGRKKEEKWNYEVPRQPRTMKNRCSCKETQKGSLKCSMFTETDRQNIFKEFWTMSWAEKKMFVDNLVTALPVKRPRGRKTYNEESKRGQSLFYHLKKDDEPIKVCRTQFLNTLGIGRWTVLNWKNKKGAAFKKNDKDFDSKQTKTSSKPFESERKELKKFLKSLPAMESHYCRASTQKKYLLPEWRSKRSLYDFYVNDWCKTRNVVALSICKFHEEFDNLNLGLFRPKKDQCEICALYKVGNKSQEEYSEHLKKKEEARSEKEKDIREENLVFTVDLQAVLMAPKSNISSLYYRTKLQIHNLAFFNLNNKDGYCYLWNETEGGLNSEEFASVWVSLIEKKLLQSEPEKPNKIFFYSDGCTYQNRNCVMSNALLCTAMNNNIIIEQKFLEVGHTQMEADSIHSSVERALKNKNINVPAEYITICKSARKHPRPYDVTYLNHSFFKSFNDVGFFKSIRPGRGKGDPKVTDMKALRYTPDGNIFFKLRFTEDWTVLPQRKSPAVTALPFDSLRNQHLTRRKITKRKFDDLQYLKDTLPADYRNYYENLPHE